MFQRVIVIIGIFFLAFFNSLLGQESTTFRGRGFIADFDPLSSTQLLKKQVFGGNFNALYCPVKYFGTGFCASTSWYPSSIKDNYNFSIVQPVISEIELGWINQFNLIMDKKIALGINLNTGLASIALGDNSIKVPQPHGIWPVPKTITSDNYFMLEPGMDFWWKTPLQGNELDLWLTVKVKYRYIVAGNTNFASPDDFSNFIFLIGFSSIIFR